MLKSLLRNWLVVNLLGIIGAAYIMLLLRSIRWQHLTARGMNGKVKHGRAAIIINWHSRIFAFPVVFGRDYRRHYIMSPSRDGQMSAWIARYAGVNRIVGSSSSGGHSAMLVMRRKLLAGDIVGINPDGPRGPARRASASLVRLAMASGVDLVPFAWSTKPCHRMGSWDRTMLPAWFGHGVYALGDAIRLPPRMTDGEVETARLAIEDALNNVTAAVDAHFGYPPDHVPHRYGSDKKAKKIRAKVK